MRVDADELIESERAPAGNLVVHRTSLVGCICGRASYKMAMSALAGKETEREAKDEGPKSSDGVQ